jgi:hypothetical protein
MSSAATPPTTPPMTAPTGNEEPAPAGGGGGAGAAPGLATTALLMPDTVAAPKSVGGMTVAGAVASSVAKAAALAAEPSRNVTYRKAHGDWDIGTLTLTTGKSTVKPGSPNPIPRRWRPDGVANVAAVCIAAAPGSRPPIFLGMDGCRSLLRLSESAPRERGQVIGGLGLVAPNHALLK